MLRLTSWEDLNGLESEVKWAVKWNKDTSIKTLLPAFRRSVALMRCSSVSSSCSRCSSSCSARAATSGRESTRGTHYRIASGNRQRIEWDQMGWELGASSGRWSIRMTGRRIGWVAICSNQRVIYILRTYNPKIPFQGPCSPTKRYLNRTWLRTPRAESSPAWIDLRCLCPSHRWIVRVLKTRSISKTI